IAQPGTELGLALDLARLHLAHFSHAIDQHAQHMQVLALGYLHNHDAGAAVDARGLAPEAHRQVEYRHHGSAQVDHTMEEPRCQRYCRDTRVLDDFTDGVDTHAIGLATQIKHQVLAHQFEIFLGLSHGTPQKLTNSFSSTVS